MSTNHRILLHLRFIRTSCADVVYHGPVFSSGNLDTREDDRVERHVVFTHELIQLYILGVLPPLGPIVSVVGSDARVTDRCVEPDIEDLLFIAFQRNRDTPLQVTSNAAWFQTFLDPGLSNVNTIVRPFAYHGYISIAILIYSFSNWILPSVLDFSLNAAILG